MRTIQRKTHTRRNLKWNGEESFEDLALPFFPKFGITAGKILFHSRPLEISGDSYRTVWPNGNAPKQVGMERYFPFPVGTNSKGRNECLTEMKCQIGLGGGEHHRRPGGTGQIIGTGERVNPVKLHPTRLSVPGSPMIYPANTLLNSTRANLFPSQLVSPTGLG